MRLPEGLRQRVEAALGTPITSTSAQGGGDINEAARLTTSAGDCFIKWNTREGMFPTEARGLRVLRQAGTALKIPDVIAVENDFLLLEWLPTERPSEKSAKRLGEGLAALHQLTEATHGLDHNNFIGMLPQSNTSEASWPVFYRDQRIRAQMKLAGNLPPEREKLLERLCERLPELLPEAAPSLLHGDLWGGNVMVTTDGTPALYDPAVYYGHREIDLAMTELFGGFSPRFYEAYQANFPLDPDYKSRRLLYQLYPLMVHMNLFGGGYTAQVEMIAGRYA
jgi:protein-ribulosamine 3-kinase